MYVCMYVCMYMHVCMYLLKISAKLSIHCPARFIIIAFQESKYCISSMRFWISLESRVKKVGKSVRSSISSLSDWKSLLRHDLKCVATTDKCNSVISLLLSSSSSSSSPSPPPPLLFFTPSSADWMKALPCFSTATIACRTVAMRNSKYSSPVIFPVSMPG